MEDRNIDINSKNNELIEDREEQKKLVHPYRKYQIYIFSMLILMIMFIIVLYKQNKRLKKFLKEKDIILTSITDIEKESKGIKGLTELIDINYKYLNRLDEKKNIDIIRHSDEIYFLSSLISKGTVTYEVCYKSKEDGDTPAYFFEKCSFYSPLVFLIETIEGYRFGVFINEYLDFYVNEGKGGYIYDSKAFIFSLNTKRKYQIKKPEYAIYVQPNNFPWFGKKDIYIGKDFTKNSSSFCDYPVAFERNSEDKGDYILNGGIKKFIIKEMEVLIPFIWDYEL